jgi:hypothetical protein
MLHPQMVLDCTDSGTFLTIEVKIPYERKESTIERELGQRMQIQVLECLLRGRPWTRDRQVRDAGLNGRLSEESRKIVADSPLLSRPSSLPFSKYNTQ